MSVTQANHIDIQAGGYGREAIGRWETLFYSSESFRFINLGLDLGPSLTPASQQSPQAIPSESDQVLTEANPFKNDPPPCRLLGLVFKLKLCKVFAFAAGRLSVFYIWVEELMVKDSLGR